jgi:hypothetical protein
MGRKEVFADGEVFKCFVWLWGGFVKILIRKLEKIKELEESLPFSIVFENEILLMVSRKATDDSFVKTENLLKTVLRGFSLKLCSS